MSVDASLLHALLAELAAHPEGVSTARLCKRLGLRMSVLLRTLAWIGEDAVGDREGPGWVRTFEDGARTMVQLTGAGRALLATVPGAPAPLCDHPSPPADDPQRPGMTSDAPPTTAPVATVRPDILVVDDDTDIVELIDRYLGAHGFGVRAAHSGADMHAALAEAAPDVVLLDLGLPDIDGLSLLQQLRTHWQGPVIVVSGRGEAVERVVGLELGADDYVAKPFDFRELLARIRSLLRRAAPAAPQPAAGPPRRLAFAHLVVDLGARRMHDADGTEIPLTTGEFDLLRALLERPNEVRSRDELMNALHGREAGPFDRAIDVAIARLRRKVEPDPANPDLIRSVRGLGYLLAAEVRQA
ncbi:response regulator [Luteimonas colneyensis]|nr:response regulator transcription factor [Luteimonas colneyensis]